MSMSPKYALITGASSGIGFELAHVYASRGFNLVLVARDQAKLHAVSKALAREYGQQVEAIALDLTKPGALNQITKQLQKDSIEIEVLINNAGFGLFGSALETDLETERNMIELNIVALTALTKHFARAMVERGHGGIMNVASTASFFPGVNMSVYYATKAYVLSYSLALAEELAQADVHVMALCPGPTKSNFAATAHAGKTRLFGRPMDARKVAEVGYRGMKYRRRVVVVGLHNKLAVYVRRILPDWLAAQAVRRASRLRKPFR